MRIAYVCMDRGVPVFGSRKGSSIHIQEMVRAFGQLGHRVEIFATDLGRDAPDDLADVTLRPLDICANGLARAERERASIRANRHLLDALRRAGPFDLVYERYSLWSHAGMEYAESHSVPGVLEVNAPLIDEQIRHRGLIDAAAAHAVADRCMSSASVVAAVSDQVGDYVRRFDAAADKVHVVANAVNPARFATPLDDGALDAEAFTVGFVGSLKAWHGVDHLLDAFALVHAEVPQSRLLIVGDGPERESIQTRAERYHLGAAMTMHGAVSHDRIPALLAGMDVGVAPYPELDNFYFSPMKVYEYMAAGLAVVASDTGQLSRLLVDEVHGLLCPPGDVGALAEALLCLQRDPALRRRLGRHAREKVLGQFTWAKAAARIVRLANASRNPPIGSIEDGNYAAQSVCS